MEFFRLKCGNLVFVSVPKYNRNKNLHIRDKKIPQQRKNMSTPETKLVHTRDKKMPHQRQNISTTEQRTKENILTAGVEIFTK